MAINANVQYIGGFLPGIILLTYEEPISNVMEEVLYL